MIVYKIRTNDGQFSRGGTWLRFNAKGKVWKRRSDLTSHINRLPKDQQQVYVARGAEVVEYELVERVVSSKSLTAYLEEMNKRKLEKQENARIGRERHEKNLRHKAYLELKKEFDQQ